MPYFEKKYWATQCRNNNFTKFKSPRKLFILSLVTCGIRCDCDTTTIYDGGDDAIMSMDGYLIHYNLLYDYMLLFLKGNRYGFHLLL